MFIAHPRSRFASKISKIAKTAKLSEIAKLAAILLALASTFAFAADPASLHGTITDPLGSVVASATVRLLNGDTAVKTTTTDREGAYRFDVPTPGLYRIEATAPTFQPTASLPTYITSSGKAEINLTLATQTYTQQISVTASATPTPIAQIGASVTILQSNDYRQYTGIQEPLRLIPGLQITQTGQAGGATALSIRGGATDANKILLDGVPVNDIGGAVDFTDLATTAIDRIEILREPNSALYGSDALAGVVSMTTARGATPLPLFTIAGDGGNFSTHHEDLTASGILHQFDYLGAFARLDTQNNLPNAAFHNGTYAGNIGWAPNSTNDLRFIVRHVTVSANQPNAIDLYGIPDDAAQKAQDTFYSGIWNNQATDRWHNEIRYGGLRLRTQYDDYAATGIPDPAGSGNFLGAPVTITGANGYTISGQAIFQYAGTYPNYFTTATDRDFVYAQTDYRFSPHLTALGGFKYEAERGTTVYTGSAPSSIDRGNYSYTLQLTGDLRNRLYYNIGSGIENNGLFGLAGTPRASLAYYLFRPSSSGLFTGTRLHASFSKGIKEPSVFQQTSSLHDVLAQYDLTSQYNAPPIGAENSRTYDGGIDQQLSNGRTRLGLTFFHNEFTNGVEDVPAAGLIQLGVPEDIANDIYAAYVNSLAFRSMGIEFEAEHKFNAHLFARGGYTYTDAVVQQSFSSDVEQGGQFNPAGNFANIPIGVYSPLVGARPFRVAPHTGYLGLNYTQTRFFASLTGTFVSRRDDSTFLTDANDGNTMLLPNRNLLGAYQRIDLSGGYRITPRLNAYANIQNLFSQHYAEAFGYPALPFTFRSGIKFTFGGESWSLK